MAEKRRDLGGAVVKAFGRKLRYTEDFVVEEAPGKGGRTRKRVRYVGAWTILTEEAPAARRKVWGAAALGAGALLLTLLLQLTVHGSGGLWYVALPKAGALLPLFFLGRGLANLPYRLRPLRRDQYEGGVIRCCRAGTALAALLLLSLLGDLGYRIGCGDWLYAGGDGLFLLFAGLGLLGALGQVWLLGRVELAQRPNGYCREE